MDPLKTCINILYNQELSITKLSPKCVFTVEWDLFHEPGLRWKVKRDNSCSSSLLLSNHQTHRLWICIQRVKDMGPGRGPSALAAVWGPHIQFLTLVSQRGISPNLPPPPLWTPKNPRGHRNVNWASNLLFHLALSVMIIKYQRRNNGGRDIWLVLCTVSFWYGGLVKYSGLDMRP